MFNQALSNGWFVIKCLKRLSHSGIRRWNSRTKYTKRNKNAIWEASTTERRNDFDSASLDSKVRLQYALVQCRSVIPLLTVVSEYKSFNLIILQDLLLLKHKHRLWIFKIIYILEIHFVIYKSTCYLVSIELWHMFIKICTLLCMYFWEFIVKYRDV